MAASLAEMIENAKLKVSVELDPSQKKRLYEKGELPRLPLAISSYAIPNFAEEKIPDISQDEIAAVSRISPGNLRLAYQIAIARKLAEAYPHAKIACSVPCALPSLTAADYLLDIFGELKVAEIIAVAGDTPEGVKRNFSVYDLISRASSKAKTHGYVTAAALNVNNPNEHAIVRKKVESGASVLCTQPLLKANACNLDTTLRETEGMKYEVHVGITIPSANSKERALKMHGFLSTTQDFFDRLDKAETSDKPYIEWVEMAKEGLRATLEMAGRDNRIAGIHLYAATGRRYGGDFVLGSALLASLFGLKAAPAK